ncbi:MAG: pyridoxamine 5'-phosphate oxidase [Sandaracinaceae bacterium]|nr:pyridoxamine 5'-phosphate oxidase [Sandaracinaceae bacterium]
MPGLVNETDPIALFLDARARAVAAGSPFDGTAAVLATASLDAAPSVRWVLVKEVGPEGFHVYTSYGSRKAAELEQNPRAALAMHWPEIGEQYRVEGPVERASAERSDAYFASRPRESQIGAWASPQSQPIASRDDLLARVRELEARFEGSPVPRPPEWGGFVLRPLRIERWVNGAARLHDRWVFERQGDGPWKVSRLAP